MSEYGLHLHRLALLRLPGLSYLQRRTVYDRLLISPGEGCALLRAVAYSSACLDAALKQAEADEHVLQRTRIRVLYLGEREYPFLLKETFDPPLALFLRGSLPAWNDRAVGVVGTRHPSAVGVSEARRLGRECAEQGLPCVSGLALGIDAWAHRGYLEAGNGAIAVLGHGLDTVYPASNRPLARRILESGGALVSEYLPGVPPWKWNFPARNRIISGLSRAVVIVDAPERSGALITGDYALDQGRDVWVSGPVVDAVDSPGCSPAARAQAAGILRLAGEGARKLYSIYELLEDWGFSQSGPVFCPSSSLVESNPDLSATTRAAGVELARALSNALAGGRRGDLRDASFPGMRGNDYR